VIRRKQTVSQPKGLALYESEGHFTADYRIEIAGEEVRGHHEARSRSMKLAIISARPVQATKGTCICLDAVNFSESSLPEK